MSPNIAIIGPGALGLLIASRLKHSGANVNIVDYEPTRAMLLNRHGIQLEQGDTVRRFHLPVVCGLDELWNIPDFIVVCVKAPQTEKVARQLVESGYDGSILTLQNGIGNVDTLRRHMPAVKLFAGVTSNAARLITIGRVRDLGRGPLVFGPVGNLQDSQCASDNFQEVFSRADFKPEFVRDIEPHLWAKLIVNIGINPLTAILKIPNGELLENHSAHTMMTHLVEEAAQIAKAKGIVLPYENPVSMVEEVCHQTKRNLSSMYQDLMSGRRTEIDFINGAIVREGASLGIHCLYNEAVTQLVTSLETLNAERSSLDREYLFGVTESLNQYSIPQQLN